MNSLLKFYAVLLLCSMLTLSCEKDKDRPSSSSSTNNSDYQITFDEYPDSGTNIANVTTDLTGDIMYSIVFETVTNAFAIHPQNGTVTVGNWLAYDYESNQTLTATVEATNGTESETKEITVTINNVDDLWAFLTTSRTAYENATPGTWIKIVQYEYNDVANYFSDVTRTGQTEDIMQNNAFKSNGPANFTVSNDNGLSMQQGSYLYAFKYYTHQSNTQGCNVKISETSHQNDFETIGSDLPTHDFGFNYFVLKGSNSPTSSTAFLGMYESNSIGYKYDEPGTYFSVPEDNSNLVNNNFNVAYLYQGLSTTTKQWD